MNDPDNYWVDALETVAACPVCGSGQRALEYRALHDHLENLPGAWDIQRCLGCSCLYLNPRPKFALLEKSYRTYYTHASPVEADAQDNGTSLPWRLVNGYLNARYGANRSPSSAAGAAIIPLLLPLRRQLDFFMRHLPRTPGRLLDIGCGNGRFLLRATRAGWQALGLEPDALAVRAAREAGLDVMQGTIEAATGLPPFDFISASHVLEHVYDPHAFLHGVLRHLKPGGTLWLATPNNRSLGHRWYRAAWRGLEPPRHVVLFSVAALRSVLMKAGFVDIRLRARGRGAGFILDASDRVARREGIAAGTLPPAVVDVLGSLSGSWAEELVVTARRPLA